MSNSVYNIVTERILKLLEKGVIPWKKKWIGESRPMNLLTKIPYRGINVWMLTSREFTSPYWITWNQTIKLKGTVKKEEAKNFEIIVFWKINKYNNKLASGEMEEKVIPMLKYYRVYNLEQVVLPKKQIERLVPKVEKPKFNPIEKAEKIIKGYTDKPEIKHGGGSACYVPLMDKIHMPEKENFNDEESYYAVLFHEAAHSTGSHKRLKRFKAADTHIFGSETYSKEELIAEMSSSFLCAESGIEDKTIENSASYIESWMKQIKTEDGRLLVSAASKADKAVDYILNGNKK